MKVLLSVLLTAALSFLTGLFLPWWSIAVIAFAVAILIPQRIPTAFLSGFLGIFLFWGGLALWIDTGNEGILSRKIAALLPLGGESLLLLLVTALVGGLVGGFAAMSGSSLRPARRKKK